MVLEFVELSAKITRYEGFKKHCSELIQEVDVFIDFPGIHGTFDGFFYDWMKIFEELVVEDFRIQLSLRFPLIPVLHEQPAPIEPRVVALEHRRFLQELNLPVPLLDQLHRIKVDQNSEKTVLDSHVIILPNCLIPMERVVVDCSIMFQG